MSHLEIVQKLNEFIKNKELDKIRPLLHKNIKWNQMKGFPNGGEYIGADEIFQHIFKGFNENWTNWEIEVKEVIETEDDILEIGIYKGIYKESGKQLKADFIHRYSIKDGIISHFKQYTDTGLFFAVMKGSKNQIQTNNPLHGVKLAEILDFLLEEYGWEGLAYRINIKCFKSNPTKKSSLNFLRKFDWAREEVEQLYLGTINN